MTLTPTPEQSAIIDLARDDQSLLISALAGAAKTSTLVMLAAKLPLVPTFCGAFNKRIADEMAKRLPSHIQSSTMNSIGHRVWALKTNRRLTVETDKSYNALKALIDSHSPEDRKRLGESFASILRATRLAKSAGYVPESMRTLGKSLVDEDTYLASIAAQVDVNPDDEFLSLVDRTLERSIADAFNGIIDFDDQIYMSTLFGGQYPKFPILMIDEAQDLSPLNHETLAQMFAGRLIAVGDPNQSIYAFRGAASMSMEMLRERFNMREMSLSVSFRCPRKVVEKARFRAPHMQYPEWAVEGSTERLSEWDHTDIPDFAWILCRNNAPLLKVAMELIRKSRGIKLVGFDIGKALVKTMQKLGSGNMAREASILALDEWRRTEVDKAPEARKAAITDRAACIRVFLEETSSIDEAIAFAERIFASSGTIQLMTGHKSKGGENPVVFHLDPFLIPSKHARRAAEEGDDAQLQQELNLRYIIITRAQSRYVEINSEDMA